MTQTQQAFEIVWNAERHLLSQVPDYGMGTAPRSLYEACQILRNRCNELSRNLRDGIGNIGTSSHAHR